MGCGRETCYKRFAENNPLVAGDASASIFVFVSTKRLKYRDVSDKLFRGSCWWVTSAHLMRPHFGSTVQMYVIM